MNVAGRLPDRKIFQLPHLGEWRRVVGLNKGELARAADLNIATVSRIEGMPECRVFGVTVNCLASALDVAPAVLLRSPEEKELWPVVVQALASAARIRLRLLRQDKSRGPDGGRAA